MKDKTGFLVYLIPATVIAIISACVAFSPRHVFGSDVFFGALGIGNSANIIGTELALFFALFASGMTIWSRIIMTRQAESTEKQIEIIGEQIVLTRRSNNNEVFVKAIELLQKKNDAVETLTAFTILQELADQQPESEYPRCMETIRNWIADVSPYKSTLRTGTARKADIVLIQKACRLLMQGALGEQAKVTDKRYDEYGTVSWLEFKGIDFREIDLTAIQLDSYFEIIDSNLEGVNLRDAEIWDGIIIDVIMKKAELNNAVLSGTYFKNVDFTGADLSNANLASARMEDVKGLTAEQILSAKWYDYEGDGRPPELPQELLDDKRIKDWLNHHHGEAPYY